MISSEDAHLLLNKWKTESALMCLVFATAEAGFSFMGRVIELSSDVIQFRGNSPERPEVLLKLAGARFEYGDAREAPESIRNSSQAKYAGALSIILPSGDRCFLIELRR